MTGLARSATVLTGALAVWLQRAGHVVDVAADGIAALERIEQVAYDVVVLDFNLLRVHGIDVLRRVRERQGDVPVMLFSALHDAEQRLASEGLRADAFLPKPFGLRDFDAMIGRLVRPAVS